MLIYGGILYDNTKVDSSLTICSKLRVYDINRNKWFENNQLDYKHMKTNMKFKHRQRYSHTSFIFNDSLHIFAGFNGFFLNDLFNFNLKSSIIPFDCTECDWIPETNSNKYRKKRQLIYPTNGDLLQHYGINICNVFESCFSCTYSPNECVWCATQAKCVLSKATQVYFPFGECINYITERSQCEVGSSINSLPQQFSYSNGNVFTSSCSNQYSNCSACIRDEKCGWCTRDTVNENETNLTGLTKSSWNTGTGLCMEGGETNSSGYKCKYNWFFSQCPACECNGHAICSSQIYDQLNRAAVFNLERNIFLDDAAKILIPKQNSFGSCGKCMNNTDGDFCSQCKIGYYGNPKNNGSW